MRFLRNEKVKNVLFLIPKESFYTNNSYANTAQVNEAFLIPAALYPTLAGPLYLDPNAIFPFYSGSFVQTPALQAQVAALKTIC